MSAEHSWNDCANFNAPAAWCKWTGAGNSSGCEDEREGKYEFCCVGVTRTLLSLLLSLLFYICMLLVYLCFTF